MIVRERILEKKRMSTKKITIPYEDILYEDLRDPHYAASYLKICYEEALKERNFRAFLLAAQHAVEVSEISMTELADDTGISRQHLYKILGGENVPSFDRISSILKSINIGISFEVDELD